LKAHIFLLTPSPYLVATKTTGVIKEERNLLSFGDG
jgi:hypothetical protein